MLMAAVASTSLGIDKGNTWPVSSEKTESAGMSFAESFEEGAPLAGKTLEPDPQQDKQMPAAQGKTSLSSKSISMDAPVVNTKGSVGTNEVDKNHAEAANRTIPTTAMKRVVAPDVSKAGANVPAQVTSRSGKLSGDVDADIPSEISHSQISSVASGDEDDPAQKLTDGVTGESSLEVADGAVDLEPEAASTAKLPLTDGTAHELVGSKGEAQGSDESQKADAAKGIAKKHGGPVKADKLSKSTTKTDEKAAIVAGVIGNGMQPPVSAPVIVNPLGGQRLEREASTDANVLSPIPSSTSKPSSGFAVASTAGSKDTKESANAKKLNEEKTEASGIPSAEGASTQKVDADTSKTGPAVNTDEDKSKIQQVTSPTTDARQSHAVSGAAASAVGDTGGKGLSHDGGTGAHIADAISHAASSVQSGSNTMTDAEVPADLAHKTLSVTPTTLEVGVSNGTHGWLKIRAEMADGGTVNTSLSTSSSAGQEMLHRDLPSLTAYLQREHVAVNSVVVQPTMAGGTGLSHSFGGTGSEHGQARQSEGQGRERQQDAANRTSAPAGTGAVYRSAAAEDALPSVSYAGGGSWLSVRA